MTAAPANMLPATEKPRRSRWPHQPTQSRPVCAAPRPWRSSTWSCRVSRPASLPTRVSTTAGAATPSSNRRNPRGPQVGFTRAWVARAPAPLRACGQSAPTAKNFVVTATPKAPLPGSRAAIDQVIAQLCSGGSDDPAVQAACRDTRPNLGHARILRLQFRGYRRVKRVETDDLTLCQDMALHRLFRRIGIEAAGQVEAWNIQRIDHETIVVHAQIVPGRTGPIIATVGALHLVV